MGATVATELRPGALPAWDASTAARIQLEDDATQAVALLERFGALLTVALDAAGRGATAELEDALAERTWVAAELRPLLSSLSAARAVRSRPAAEQAAVTRVLARVDEALRNAGLLHARTTDATERWAPIALVR
jgi:hypothetical protein